MEIKKSYIIIFVILILLFVTNPSRENHLDTYSTYLEVERPAPNIFGSALMPAFIKNNTNTSNYLFFSTTAWHTNQGRNDVVTVGILGNVFVIDERDYSQ